MGVVTLTLVPSGGRLADLAQLLEEHHLVVLGDLPSARRWFARAMADHLGGLAGAQVVRIDGTSLRTPADVTRALVAAGLGPVRASGAAGLVPLLRRVADGSRHRYIIWSDADEMLEHDVRGFSEVVNAMLAVSVEHEHLSAERLVLQRVVFLGGAKLGAYAEEEHGQFRRWLLDGSGIGLRTVSEFISRPPVLTYRIDG